MKNRIIFSLAVILLVVFATLCGCQKKTYAYTLEQDLDHVEKVELCRYIYHTSDPLISPIAVLDKSEADSLLQNLGTLECYRHFGDHTQDFGEIVVKITYTDGQAEVIGSWNTGHVDTEGKLWLTGYYFDEEAWKAFLQKNVSSDILADVDGYFDGIALPSETAK